jgi:hypothetical protein
MMVEAIWRGDHTPLDPPTAIAAREREDTRTGTTTDGYPRKAQRKTDTDEVATVAAVVAVAVTVAVAAAIK